MTFSIVIPAYNGSEFIEKTILSALRQTRMPDEIIIHDDNSRDSTRLICEQYKSKVKYFFNNEGPSGFVNGWNKAISLATCEYISILHQDDILYPTFLEETEKTLKANHGIRHLFSLVDYINEKDELINTIEPSIRKEFKNEVEVLSANMYLKAYQRNYNGMPHIHRCPGVVTHRSIFENGCTYNPQAGHIADDDFFYRVGQFTPVVGIMKPLAAYRIHHDSETGKVTSTELVRRLAHDYVFQVKQWQNSNFTDKLDKYYFEYWALNYIFQLIYFAFKLNNKVLIHESFLLYKSFKVLKLNNIHFIQRFKLKLISILFSWKH